MANKTKTKVVEAEIVTENAEQKPAVGRSDAEIMAEFGNAAKPSEKQLDSVMSSGVKAITDGQKRELSVINRISKNGEINLADMTEKEIRECASYGSKLNVRDINSISSFGADLQKVMNENSKKLLASTHMNRVGDDTTQIVNEMMEQIGRIDLGDIKPPSPIVRFIRKVPILKNLVSSLEKFLAEYKDIEDKVSEVEKKLETAQVIALRNNTVLQNDFDDTVKYIGVLEKLILAAKMKSEEIDRGLEIMKANPENYTPIQIQDLQAFKNTLDHKISNMLVWRVNFSQSLFRIRDIQRANIQHSNDAKDTIQNMMPMFRQQIAQAQALYELEQGMNATRSVKEGFNKILKQNADAAHDLAVQAAKDAQETDITMETLEYNQKRIEDTMIEVKKLWDDFREKSKADEARCAEMQRRLENIAMGYDGDANINVNSVSPEAIEAKYTGE